MNKTSIITIILYTLVLIIVGWLYFNQQSDYKHELRNIETEYNLKYDSLNLDIKKYEKKIDDLDSINIDLSNTIDSIKNNQNDYEKPIYTPFSSLSPDSISSLFARYNLDKEFK